MNKGLKENCKIIKQSIGNSCDAYLNVNKNDANMYVKIPIYSSRGKAPIKLDLTFTLSDKDKEFGYGKGLRLNYNKIISGKSYSDSDYTLNVINEDGSTDKYYRIKKTNKFKCDETKNYIIDKWNDKYEYNENKIELIDQNNTRYIYSYNKLQCPNKIIFKDGNNITIESKKVNNNNLISCIYKGSKNNPKELIEITHPNSDTTEIVVTKNEVVTNNITIKRNSLNHLEKIIYINKAKKQLTSNYNFDFDNKLIEIQDCISNYRVKYILDNKNKVKKIEDGYNSSLLGGKTLKITYDDNLTKLTNYKNQSINIFFDKNNLPMYEVDSHAGVISYEFDNKKRLISKSNAQNNNPKFASKYSIIKHGYFESNFSNWTRVYGESSIIK